MDAGLRLTLKHIRDETKTPYDVMPNGQTLGQVANTLAMKQYTQKIKKKRERARQSRKAKQKEKRVETEAKT